MHLAMSEAQGQLIVTFKKINKSINELIIKLLQ